MEGARARQKLSLKVVPWMNKLEFETVYKSLYSNNPLDQRWAVDRTSAWAARGHVAELAGVQTTADLVRATIQDYAVQHNISVSNYDDVSLMYCMALIRFVNVIVEKGQDREYRVPLRVMALRFGIPEWIIELRHQASHSSAPSLEKLRLGAETCLEWLDRNFWKPELENTRDYCPATTYNEKEVDCREAVLNFQSSQCQSFFGTAKSDQKKERKKAITCIAKLAKQNGKCLVNTLAKPEFLLSLTACSRPLFESSDAFIQEEAVALPRNIERFWIPVISVIHKKDLLGELVLCLLRSVKNACDENQRMAMAWVWEIVSSSCESWDSSTSKDSELSKVLKVSPPIFNWFELMVACLHSYSKYIPAVLPILVDHVYPPIPSDKKDCLMGLVAIATGALADVCCDTDVPKEEQRIYTVDDIKTVLELQGVIDRGETSLYHTENPWKVSTDDINWAHYPLGYVFGLGTGVVGPRDLELSQVSNEDKHTTPSEAVAMECDEHKTLHGSTEVTFDKERIEEDLAVEDDDDESYANGCNADYLDPEDIFVL